MNIIEKYRFGKIVVNGESFSKDLIIFPDEIKTKWWRKQGHSLHLDDLVILDEKKIEVLIIGTGAFGRVNVPSDVIQKLNERDIVVIAKKTSEAVEEYNKLAKENKIVAAALHLNC